MLSHKITGVEVFGHAGDILDKKCIHQKGSQRDKAGLSKSTTTVCILHLQSVQNILNLSNISLQQ